MIAGLIASAVAIVVMGVNTWLYAARLRRLAIEAANYRFIASALGICVRCGEDIVAGATCRDCAVRP